MDVAHQHELNLLTGFLGVPGYILSTFLPSIQQLAARQPRLVKVLCVFVALTTFGFSVIERIKKTLLSFLVSYFMFSTTIDSNDPLYTYVLRWLRSRKKILPEQELQARSKEDLDRNIGNWTPPHGSSPGLLVDPEPNKDVLYDFHGLQIFWHNWKPYFVAPYPHGRLGNPNYLTVRCFGFSSQPLKEIIDEAWKVHREKDHAQLTAVYRPVARSGGWKCVARRNRRSIETIVLDKEQKEKLLEDVGFYLSGQAKEWYAARGIPYRRGYLFHGRPGTGKTSLSMAIAGQFGLDIYIVSLNDPHINDTFLHTFFTNLPKGALILLEDIDSAGLARETFDRSLSSFRGRGRGGYRFSSRFTRPATQVTLSGLLNAIDGADSPEGHLLIMTTNVPDALDEALVRPGRIDYKIGFKAVSPPQARAIFLRMYTDDHNVDAENFDLDQLADDFSRRVPDDKFTPAELQGHLLRYKRRPLAALDSFNEWKDGVLEERRQLEEARRKQEERHKKKEEKKKKKREAAKKRSSRRRKSSGIPHSASSSDNSSDTDTDTNSSDTSGGGVSSHYISALSDYDLSESSCYSELNGDPTHANRNAGGLIYVDSERNDLVYPPVPVPRGLDRRGRGGRRNERPRSTGWDELNGRERTCVVM